MTTTATIIIIPMVALSHSFFQMSSKRHRAESFELCCHWALLAVQNPTLLFKLKAKGIIMASTSKHPMSLFFPTRGGVSRMQK